jgi:hypothetical protein
MPALRPKSRPPLGGGGSEKNVLNNNVDWLTDRELFTEHRRFHSPTTTSNPSQWERELELAACQELLEPTRNLLQRKKRVNQSLRSRLCDLPFHYTDVQPLLKLTPILVIPCPFKNQSKEKTSSKPDVSLKSKVPAFSLRK